jgi:small subunit ribosomal protein S21
MNKHKQNFNKNWKAKRPEKNQIQDKGRSIAVVNGNVNIAIRKLKKVLEKMEFQKELSKREYYEKPSAKRKRKKDQAVKRHNKELDIMIMKGEWMPTPITGQKHLKGKRQRRKEYMGREKISKLRGRKP